MLQRAQVRRLSTRWRELIARQLQTGLSEEEERERLELAKALDAHRRALKERRAKGNAMPTQADILADVISQLKLPRALFDLSQVALPIAGFAWQPPLGGLPAHEHLVSVADALGVDLVARGEKIVAVPRKV
jgi:hypothetical protein